MLTAAAPARREGTRVVVLLSWAHFLNDGASNYLPGILPLLLASLALPLGSAGAIMGILIAWQALQPLAGLLSDRGAGRAFVLAGLAGSSLGAACIGWSSSTGTLIAALVLIGICNSLFHPPALAMVRAQAADSGERANALFLVGGEIGRGLWPLLASLVVSAWSLHSLWILSLAAIPTLPWLARGRHGLPVPPARPRPTTIRQGVRAGGRPLGILLAYSGLRGVLIVGVSAFVPLLWQARGCSLVFGAGLISTMLVVGIIGNLGAAELARHGRPLPGASPPPPPAGRRPPAPPESARRNVVRLGTLLCCLFLPAAIVIRGVWLWFAMAGLGIALFATVPLTVVMIQDLMPRQHSLGSGLALGFSNAVGAGLVALLGLLAPVWGAQGVLWSFEACALLALGLSLAFPVVRSAIDESTRQ